MQLMLLAAIVPVILLCSYVYKKDSHKEPKGTLAKIFIGGAIAVIPIVILELIVGGIFNTDDPDVGVVRMFINVFFGIALIEEGFKWLVTKIFGYNSKHFDEVYDIIVYAVFASLGFACIENVSYVFVEVAESGMGNGLFIAAMRALLSVPGHACDGIFMGYFLAKAKVASANNKGLSNKYMVLSLLVPTLTHTAYDALLMIQSGIGIIIFFVGHIVEVVLGFIVVKKMAKTQDVITTNVSDGVINSDANGVVTIDNKAIINNNTNINFCPMCGTPVKSGDNYCSSCGFKIR